jgi:hypothetical protein
MSAPQLADTAAQIAWAKAVKQDITEVASGSTIMAIDQLASDTNTYLAVLQADNLVRQAHPLGKC